MISEMCFQVNFCLWSCHICYKRCKIVSSFGLRNVYILTLRVGSFSLLFTCCRVLVMAAMLVVNGFIRWGAGVAHWWERSPTTNVSRVRFLQQCCVNVFRFIWEGTPVQTSRTAQTPKTQECTRKRPLGQAPSRPTGTFAMFIKENTDVVMKENPGLDAATRWGVLKNLWEECGLPTKWLMKEKADKKYKEEVEKAKREMESLQPLQTDKQAFNRLDWGQIQTKEWMCRRISVFENYLCFL